MYSSLKIITKILFIIVYLSCNYFFKEKTYTIKKQILEKVRKHKIREQRFVNQKIVKSLLCIL